jgi:8-oxo-dGTP pyrophosphatase MutT (NUDIX family)
VPKGWPSKGLKDHKMAAREAEEEAGVVGEITPDPASTFVYLKRLTAESIEVEVTLFVLRVRREMDRWRENKARTRRWFTLKEAARRVQEPELQAHIRNAKKLFAALPSTAATKRDQASTSRR